MVSAPSTDLLLLRRELVLTKREAELRLGNQIAFYSPHEKQKTFHDAAIFRYRYARTGNRFGKSEMGAAEDVSFALGFRPWIAEGDPLRNLGIPLHPTKGLIITTDWDKSTEVFTETEGDQLGKLFKYIPKRCLGTPTKNHSGAIDRIPVRHITGGWSMIHLDTVKSFKQNPLGQESGSHDFIHIDEPIPEAMWIAIARGLVDRGGRAWFTCTPLTEPWIDQAFVPDMESQNKVSVSVSNIALSRFMMTGSMDDNPHNKTEDIESFMSFVPKEQQYTRRTGIPAAYSGIVYKEFNWDVHVMRDVPLGWKNWRTPPDDYTIRAAIDYHPRKPHAVLFVATSPKDVHYVYEELWTDCLMAELFSQIKGVLGKREVTTPILIDPLADTQDRVTGVTPMDELQRLGLPLLPATKDPYNGILKVKEILHARDRYGKPIIHINGALTRFLFEISRGYMWDKETNKPVKNNDDMMEDLYRLCLHGLPYIEPSSSADFTPIPPRELPANVLEFPDSPFDDFLEADRESIKRRSYANRYRA